VAVWNSFKAKIMDGSIDLDTDNINVSLHTSALTPNIDNQTFYSDITASECTSTYNYTTKGQSLASKSVAIDTVDDEGTFDATDVTWSSSTITARYACVWKNTGVNATSPLIAYVDFGSDKTSDNGNFIITWSSEGILNLN
jgi:hypothetical protein